MTYAFLKCGAVLVSIMEANRDPKDVNKVSKKFGFPHYIER